ncbi:MAG TPA: family 20 glycosylhydrolase [Bacteroidales bacterium]|nr:family 20 glycosylhydrolase [Bacteroidales bacterium]
MKRILKITANVLLVLACLFVALIIFLLAYYSMQSKQIAKQKQDLSQNMQTRVIQADTIVTSAGVLNLLPVPQSFRFNLGTFRMPEEFICSISDSLKENAVSLFEMFPFKISFSGRKANLVISADEAIPSQGYKLDIQPEKILLSYADNAGFHYALTTIKVLNQNYNGIIPCITIEDHPDLPVRGLMVDISRNKVPTLNTLKQIISLVADLKYNHLELYVEGFSFGYPSFSQLWKDKETPVTCEEIKILDSLSRKCFIDLVPNQNSLGHMMAWLSLPEYAGLAECPDGYKFMGLIDMKATMDPTNPGSLDLVKKMTDDMLPCFTSSKFNVNLDEPFELGKGKSKKAAQKLGVEGVYLDYTLKIHDMVSSKNKEMLMWGDIVMRHPEILKKLPKDVTILDWGYEAGYPFERNCKTLEKSGISYMVCPGTSSWTSITGRTNNMLGNIASATVNGVRYNASGMLLTDWGDMGHWQYLPVSYAGYVTGGALSWNSKSSKEFGLVPFLDHYVFKDDRQIMGNLVLDLGQYRQFEEVPVPNMTTTMLSLQFGLMDNVMIHAIYEKISSSIIELMKDLAPELITDYNDKYNSRHPFDFSGMYTFLDEKEALLKAADMKTPDSTLVLDEYLNAIRLLRTGTTLQHYIENRNDLKPGERKAELSRIRILLDEYLNENNRLWLARNKEGGYDTSISVLKNLQNQITKEIETMDKSYISRMLARFREKIITSAAVIYITKIA